MVIKHDTVSNTRWRKNKTYLTLLLNFAAFVDPLNVKYIEVFYADISYLSIY